LPGTTVSGCSFAADPAEQRVTITLPNQEIALTYTGEAGEAKPAEPSPVDRQKAGDAILEAIGLKGARKPGPREEAGTPEKPSVAPPDKK
jgi:hypothetical protein